MITIFDHIFTPLRNNDLDGALRRFERAGFLTDPEKVRHRRGRLTGFVRLTGSYLELLSVVDEREFNRESAHEDRILRDDPQPYGVGAITDHPEAIHALLKKNHPEIRPVMTQTQAGDNPGAARWTLCMMPRRAFPGANVFAIKYHEKSPEAMALRQGPNTIFALGGFVLCTVRGDEYRRKWEANLNLLQGKPEVRDRTLAYGGQDIEWISPEEYSRRYGRAYNRMYEELGTFAAVKLWCSDRALAERYLTQAGFEMATSDGSLTRFYPDQNTGFAFELIERQPMEFLQHYDRATQAAA